ncbi:MAG: glycosyltransferase family 2 protein [Nitrososphaerota archaeon]|jgi:glycosyltransferase involved in cell wall biosynthesis|nr:glycosyltransferase family 2 protein [Nitrososphaerota archaeon]
MVDSIDVILLTKNSAQVLSKCLNALYQNVPVHRLIVVDGYSTDDTLAIVETYDQIHHNVDIIFDHGTRASARQKGIMAVQTEWFMFIDSDVVLCHDWFKKATKNIKPHVGAIWGIEVWSTLKNPKMLKLFLIITRKIFEIRGGTHDTLIRSELVKDIQIPNKLHVFEDAYIKEYITKKGYTSVACYDPFCIHFRSNSVWTFKGSLNLVIESLLLGNPRLISKLLLSYSIYTGYSVYQFFTNNK